MVKVRLITSHHSHGEPSVPLFSRPYKSWAKLICMSRPINWCLVFSHCQCKLISFPHGVWGHLSHDCALKPERERDDLGLQLCRASMRERWGG